MVLHHGSAKRFDIPCLRRELSKPFCILENISKSLSEKEFNVIGFIPRLKLS